MTVSAACAGGVLRVEITDQGIGIPQELLQQVFEPFFRVDPSRSRQLGGAGLGLSLVRAIAELHNGQVWAEPAPGGGSRFILLLPESEAPPA
ncbi:ATP-binding protein [Flavonifractor sp. An306]|uniref:ATP-binding protein n=1 Tax=Flavonifractor sp. An306 TaxID=1965629 RepID=UPI0013A6756A|nr:ATP-binding protein [Flavonifractor sp. An306]